jgi:6-pyruvoyltetrahydropterin/6-carboxytetrahydropterin synthase
MSTTIIFEGTFDAAHFLPHVPQGHKCGRMHGHSYKVEVHATGPLLQPQGWVVDFAVIDAALAPCLLALDHHLLNDIAGLANPTCENVAAWLWQALRPQIEQLSAVVVHESTTSRCMYTGL